jgi:hypothetical protein
MSAASILIAVNCAITGTPIWAVVFTSIWAKSPARRRDARRVLRIILRSKGSGVGDET